MAMCPICNKHVIKDFRKGGVLNRSDGKYYHLKCWQDKQEAKWLDWYHNNVGGFME